MIKGVVWDYAYREPSKQGDLVANPVEQLEWIMRLQNNFVDNIVQYDIALTGYGSIDSTSLDELRTRVSSRELLSENEMTTDYLIKSLCKEFFLINWQNGNGQECLEYIFKPRANEFSFSFDEIFDITPIKPPSKYNIYVEPVINYAYDYATEKYTKQARVLGITTESTWSATLTPGFTATDGELIWNKCKQLYDHYGHYEPMPEELSNKLWITEDTDAFWWINRYYGLEISGFCDWSRCSIDVGYYDALYSKQVDIGMIGTINLPHQTGGLDMQCMIESITPKKREKVVTLDIILLDKAIEPIGEEWQDNDDSGEIIQGGDTGEIIQEN